MNCFALREVVKDKYILQSVGTEVTACSPVLIQQVFDLAQKAGKKPPAMTTIKIVCYN